MMDEMLLLPRIENNESTNDHREFVERQANAIREAETQLRPVENN